MPRSKIKGGRLHYFYQRMELEVAVEVAVLETQKGEALAKAFATLKHNVPKLDKISLYFVL